MTLGVDTVTVDPRCEATAKTKLRLERVLTRAEALTLVPVVVIVSAYDDAEVTSVNTSALEVMLESAASTALRTVSRLTAVRRRRLLS